MDHSSELPDNIDEHNYDNVRGRTWGLYFNKNRFIRCSCSDNCLLKLTDPSPEALPPPTNGTERPKTMKTLVGKSDYADGCHHQQVQDEDLCSLEQLY